MNSKQIVKMGEQISKYRKAKRYTQQEIAQAADISVNYYATIERGESVPSLDVLEKITKALGVKSSDVLPF